MKKPVIDWELGQKLAGNNLQRAQEMLSELLDHLPGHVDSIQAAYQQQDRLALKEAVHHLHGALCYCGTPSLKEAARNLEIAIIKEHVNIDLLFQNLMQEITAVRGLRPKLETRA